MTPLAIIATLAGAGMGGSLAWFVGKNKKSCATGGG